MSPSHSKDKKNHPTSTRHTAPTSQNNQKSLGGSLQQASPDSALQRVTTAPSAAMRPQDMLTLQRTIGNQAVQRLIQTRQPADQSVSVQARSGPNTIQRMNFTVGEYELDSDKLEAFKRKIDAIRQNEGEKGATRLLEQIANKLREEGEETDAPALQYVESALHAMQNGEDFQQLPLDYGEKQSLPPLMVGKEHETKSKINTNSKEPYEVFEKKSKWLKSEELQDEVIAPNVSGCAAIKISVFIKESEEAKEKLDSTVAFHSDGTKDSIEEAKSIGTQIAKLRGFSKRVTVLVITNEHANTMSNDHVKVLQEFKTALGDTIACAVTNKGLKRKTKDRMNIDLTGNENEILDRYKGNLDFTEEEKQKKRDLLPVYEELAAEARKLGILRMPDKYMNNTNSRYITSIDKQAWSKLDPEQAQEAVDELRRKIKAAKKGKCIIS